MTTEEKIRAYINDNFMFGDVANIGANESFLDRGIIDSTGILEIVLFIEEEFGIKVADKEMLPENLDSIANIVRFVERSKAAK